MCDSESVIIERIHKLMNEKGCNIKTLAKAVELSESTMRRYLKGDIGKMKQTKIANISNFFGVSPAYIMTYFIVLAQDRQQAVQTFSNAMILYKAIGIKDTDIDVYRSGIAQTAPDVFMMLGRR